MSLNETVSAERIHIGFFGLRNAGKSSLVNAVTGQNLSLVSDVKGTTTDPVRKAMELLPLGPVVIIDTPGIDDEGQLGQMRVERARQVLRYTDIAVLVTDASKPLQPADRELLDMFRQRQIPYIIAYNKCDLLDHVPAEGNGNEIHVSAKEGTGIHELKEALGRLTRDGAEKCRKLVADLVNPGDLVILVTPIDESAPKGRMILPQQMVLRDVLDTGAMAMVCRETELEQTLSCLGPDRKPRMVITDSQVFRYVSKILPEDIPLTSFSILMVRYKGDLEAAVHGAVQLSRLKAGDRVLISEGCTHHRQCNDIGTVKVPGWICGFTGLRQGEDGILFEFTSGGQFTDDLSPYSLIVHCGGCMLNDREMEHRTRLAAASGIPMTNYGIAIAQMHGILRRSVQLFPDALAVIDDLEREKTKGSLVRLLDLDDDFIIDLKYAGQDNFTGQQIYRSAECYINRCTAERLIMAKNRFCQDGYRVKIFDAYRPVSAQVRFWEVMPDERFVARPPDLSKPAEWKASHMNGLCVDLTLTDSEGREIEMPTPFDEMTERASLAWSGHSNEAKTNGEYLKQVMEACGFAADEEEWWHFYDVSTEPVPYTDFKF